MFLIVLKDYEKLRNTKEKLRKTNEKLRKLSRTFPGILLENSWKLPGNFPEISCTFPGHLWKFPGNFLEFFRKFPGQFRETAPEFSWKSPAHFPGNVPEKIRKNPGHFREFFRIDIIPQQYNKKIVKIGQGVDFRNF